MTICECIQFAHSFPHFWFDFCSSSPAALNDDPHSDSRILPGRDNKCEERPLPSLFCRHLNRGLFLANSWWPSTYGLRCMLLPLSEGRQLFAISNPLLLLLSFRRSVVSPNYRGASHGSYLDSETVARGSRTLKGLPKKNVKLPSLSQSSSWIKKNTTGQTRVKWLMN